MSQKLLKKLQDKKYRDETGLFLVEGKKGIEEALASDLTVVSISTTLENMAEVERAVEAYTERRKRMPEILCVSESVLGGSGTFKTNNAGIAIVEKPAALTEGLMLEKAKHEPVLVLDDVQDPGNLGTIIRTADWFGITHIITSKTSTDPYGPKAVNASMGSFTRVSIAQFPLLPFLESAHAEGIPSLGAFLEGTNVYEKTVFKNGLIVMGSESHGIKPELEALITEKITIPRKGGAESLNVAMATGVILALLLRP